MIIKDLNISRMTFFFLLIIIHFAVACSSLQKSSGSSIVKKEQSHSLPALKSEPLTGNFMGKPWEAIIAILAKTADEEPNQVINVYDEKFENECDPYTSFSNPRPVASIVIDSALAEGTFQDGISGQKNSIGPLSFQVGFDENLHVAKSTILKVKRMNRDRWAGQIYAVGSDFEINGKIEIIDCIE